MQRNNFPTGPIKYNYCYLISLPETDEKWVTCQKYEIKKYVRNVLTMVA